MEINMKVLKNIKYANSQAQDYIIGQKYKKK